MDGNLVLEIKSRVESELRSAVGDMKPEEAAVLALLRGRLAKQAEEPEHANLKKLSGKRRRALLELGHSRRACSIPRGDEGFLCSCTMPRVDLVEPDADRADQRMRRHSQELKWAHRGWRRFLDEPARRAAPLVALPGLRLHFMTCPSVRFRTFPLKHVHCGSAVTIDVCLLPRLAVLPHSQLLHYAFSESRRTRRV
jgi:hypothetical protein